MIYIGIDPGVSGGIAMLDDWGKVLQTEKMPATERDLRDVLDKFGKGSGREGRVRALLERVSASPQMGVVSAFTFGRGYGRLEMALTAFEIPFDYVTPGKWQQALGCRTGGDKNVSKRRAQQLFPSQTVTHAIADALLLAEYCRRNDAIGNRREEQTDGEARQVRAETQGGHGTKEGRKEGGAAQGAQGRPYRDRLEEEYEKHRDTQGLNARRRSPVAGAPRPRAGSERPAG